MLYNKYFNSIIQHVSETFDTLVPQITATGSSIGIQYNDIGYALYIPASGRINLECFTKGLSSKLKLLSASDIQKRNLEIRSTDPIGDQPANMQLTHARLLRTDTRDYPVNQSR